MKIYQLDNYYAIIPNTFYDYTINSLIKPTATL